MNDYFTEGSSGVCVWGIGRKQNTGVSKANQVASHIWLKTKLRIDSEIITIDPETLKRESRCIDGYIFPPTHIYIYIYIHSIAKSIGSPILVNRFDYFTNFHEYKS